MTAANPCLSTCPQPAPPAGMLRETVRAHPSYRHLLVPLACELEAGHDGIHRAGLLTWHDPPLFVLGGRVQ